MDIAWVNIDKGKLSAEVGNETTREYERGYFSYEPYCAIYH